MNVLSLFDGYSGAQVSLNKAGIAYDNYFASEIDKFAMRVTQKNYPNTIQVGDVCKLKASDLPKIDLLVGGSPCQGFSNLGKGLNFEDERSKLFFEYVRLLKELKPTYFILENVYMKQEWQNIISKELEIEPICIDSSLLSAQRRKRLYWTNINSFDIGLFSDKVCMIPQPKDKRVFLKHILQPSSEIDDKYYILNSRLEMLSRVGRDKHKKGYLQFCNQATEKAQTLRARSEGSWSCNYILQINETKSFGNQPRNQDRIYHSEFKSACLTTFHNQNIFHKREVRKLTPIECERLQTLPDNYTNHVSDNQRYKMLGNGFTADVIAYILSFIKK